MAEGFSQSVQRPEEEHGLVRTTITNFQGQQVRLTARQWRHILNAHPDMVSMEPAIRETLESPEEVRRSRDDPNTVKLYYRRYPAPPSSKMVCVIVKSLESDAFILTAYQTYKVIEGELIWRKEP